MARREGKWTALAARTSAARGLALGEVGQVSLRRRIDKRMRMRGLSSFEEYVHLLGANPGECRGLARALEATISYPGGRSGRPRRAQTTALRRWAGALPVGAVVAEAIPLTLAVRFLACNRQAADLLGSPECALRAESEGCQWLYPDRAPCCDEDLPLYQALWLGTAAHERSFLLRDSSGVLRPVIVSAARLPGRYGRRALLSIQATAPGAAWRSPEQEAADRLRGDLLDLVLHDLRSPLATTILGAETIERYLGQNDIARAQRSLAMTSAALRRLSRLVDSLLDAGRLDAGQSLLHWTEVAPAELLAAAAEEVQLAMAAHNLDLQLELPPDLPAIVADGDMVFRAVINLLDNAIKFSPPRGQIWLKAAAQDYGLLVTVADQGPGIPRELQPRIFDKFIGLHLPQAPRGYGLGLSFCKLAIEAHGGWVAVDSSPGQGSTFALWLPVEPPLRIAQ